MYRKKVRNHTAVSRSSKTKGEEYLKHDSLPSRPKTSLGFDRESTQINAFLSGTGGRKKANGLRGKPTARFAFNAETAKNKTGVPPLEKVVAGFIKQERQLEKVRSSSANSRPTSTFKRERKPRQKLSRITEVGSSKGTVSNSWLVGRDKSVLKQTKEEELSEIDIQSNSFESFLVFFSFAVRKVRHFNTILSLLTASR